jgi:hypothetical protein
MQDRGRGLLAWGSRNADFSRLLAAAASPRLLKATGGTPLAAEPLNRVRHRRSPAITYLVSGLDPALFAPLFTLDGPALAARRARRAVADGPGFPCRVSLEEAEAGEPLILVNHVSQGAATPFRASHAIYVREAAREAAVYRGEIPPILAARILGLRGFDAEGMLRDARLAPPGEADAAIRALFVSEEIVEIHAHNAALGCFLARIVRD